MKCFTNTSTSEEQNITIYPNKGPATDNRFEAESLHQSTIYF